MAFVFFPLSAMGQNASNSYGFRTPEWSAQRIVSSFTNIGGTITSSNDNSSIRNSGFDFTAFFNHPCYQPVGTYVQESCNLRFGAYGNLKAAVENQEVRALLADTYGSDILSLFDSIKEQRSVVQAEKEAAAIKKNSAVRMYTNRHDRSLVLWNECKKLFARQAASCFQNNIRLISNTNVAIGPNLHSRRLR